jgi:hypothetical protein
MLFGPRISLIPTKAIPFGFQVKLAGCPYVGRVFVLIASEVTVRFIA